MYLHSKSADCSIAFGSGSEAACNAAQIVLVNSDFSCMPSVVLEGRRVVNNIQRTASLFLVKNIFSMLLALFTLIVGHRYPLYPTQLSLLGAFTIGAPGFLLAMQRNRSRIKGRFLVNVAIKALPAALTDFLLVAIFTVYNNFSGISHEQLSTSVIFILLTVGMAELYRVCRRLIVQGSCLRVDGSWNSWWYSVIPGIICNKQHAIAIVCNDTYMDGRCNSCVLWNV